MRDLKEAGVQIRHSSESEPLVRPSGQGRGAANHIIDDTRAHDETDVVRPALLQQRLAREYAGHEFLAKLYIQARP